MIEIHVSERRESMGWCEINRIGRSLAKEAVGAGRVRMEDIRYSYVSHTGEVNEAKEG